MAVNQSLDSLFFDKLEFPFNKIEEELSPKPRIVDGRNMYVTTGGALARRPGTTAMTNGLFAAGYLCDRLWLYETLDVPPKVYLMSSMFRFATGRWEMWYQRLSSSPGVWTIVPPLRSINVSSRPHEGFSARGRFFIKSYPDAATGERLGTVQFDGSPVTPTTRVWGALGPTTPAAITGAINRLSTSINDTTTAITVVTAAGAAGFPAAPFNIQVDFEEMTVTSIGGGTNWTAVRAVNGTVASAHANNTIVLYRNWTASSHAITVNLTWRYSYCYKTTTGHYTNRAPEQTNPDLLPNTTGAFIDLCPQITVQGLADTTNFPTIAVLRSTDGGGTYFVLEEVTNTGAGAISYRDDSLGSGPISTIFNDPIPDTVLDTFSLSPSLTSNSTPPAVIAPKVTGTDPIESSTPLAYYATRIWYAIGNILFYAANEELPIGVPEEAFPSGLSGNFYRFQAPVTNLIDTGDALFVMTLQGAYIITGTTKDTFNLRPIYNQLGHPAGHPRAIVRYMNSIAFLTHDFKIANIIESNEPQFISDPLDMDIVSNIVAGGEGDMEFWSDLDKEWVFFFSHRVDNPALSRQWMYNTKMSRQKQEAFWSTPWTMPTTASTAGRASEVASQTKLIVALYDAGTQRTQFATLDLTALTDAAPAGAAGYTYSWTTNLFSIPAGNHVNMLRRPELVPVLYSFTTERLSFVGEDDPAMAYYLDDIWTAPLTPPAPAGPPRRDQSKGYKTIEWHINNVCQRTALTLSAPAGQDAVNAEFQSLTIAWEPEGGGGS